MNNHIRQLADRAKKSVPHGLTPDKWIEVYNQKFAELIVQENVDLLRKEWYALNNQETPENETPRELGIRLGKKTELITMIHKIKEHFGVEE
jgi:hypothetical protein